MKKMQYGGKSTPGSTKIKKDGKWVNISDMVFTKMAESAKRKKAENSGASKPVTILKGVDRRDEIGKPLTPMVLKKPSTASSSTSTSVDSKSRISTPSRAKVITSKSAPSKTTGSTPTKTVGGSKSSPSKIRKPVSFSPGIKSPSSFKNMDTKLKANVSSPKSFADMPRSKSSESNSSTDSKSSASPLSKRATMKGLRKEKRSERKLTRMDRREDRQDRRENRIINKTAKLKAKR